MALATDYFTEEIKSGEKTTSDNLTFVKVINAVNIQYTKFN